MVLNLHGHLATVVIADPQGDLSAAAFVPMDDGVGYSLGYGGFQVCNFAEGGAELHRKGSHRHPGEGFIFRKGRESEHHMVARHKAFLLMPGPARE